MKKYCIYLIACGFILVSSNFICAMDISINKSGEKKESIKSKPLSQFMRNYYFRKLRIEEYKKLIEKYSIQIDLLKKNVGEKKYLAVCDGVKDHWEYVHVLRENVGLKYVKLMLPKYYKDSARSDLLRALFQLYKVEAFILKYEDVPSPYNFENYIVGAQIELCIDKDEKISNKALMKDIYTNIKKKDDELFLLLKEKTKKIKESLEDLETKEALLNTFYRFKKARSILNFVKEKKKNVTWIQDYFVTESNKKILIVDRKGYIKFLEGNIKHYKSKIDICKKKCDGHIYDNIVKKVEDQHQFLSIFLTLESVDAFKAKLSKKFEVVYNQDSDKKELLRAFEHIMIIYLGILTSEKYNELLLLKPHVEADKIKKNLGLWLKHHEEKSSREKLLKVVTCSKKRLEGDYKDLSKKEELINQTSKLTAVIKMLEENKQKNKQKISLAIK